MEQGRVEAQQSKVQIEQGADAHCGNDGTDAHLTAQPPADEYNDHFHGGAAKAYRPVRLTGQYDHEGIPRARAQRALYIHPGAQSQQLHADQQCGQSGREALKQRDPVQVQQDVDEYRADENICQRTEAETLPAKISNGNDCGPDNAGGGTVGDAEGLGDTLLKHQRDADGADQQTDQKQSDPAKIFLKHGLPPSAGRALDMR